VFDTLTDLLSRL